MLVRYCVAHNPDTGATIFAGRATKYSAALSRTFLIGLKNWNSRADRAAAVEDRKEIIGDFRTFVRQL